MVGLPASSKDDSLKSLTKEQPEPTKHSGKKQTRMPRIKELVKVEQIQETNGIRRREPAIREEDAETSSALAEAFLRTCAVAPSTDPESQKTIGQLQSTRCQAGTADYKSTADNKPGQSPFQGTWAKLKKCSRKKPRSAKKS